MACTPSVASFNPKHITHKYVTHMSTNKHDSILPKSNPVHIVNNSHTPWSTKVPVVDMQSANLDWEVTKNPLITLLDGRYPLPIESHMSINRSDTNETIGIVGHGYGIIQNSQIWEALHRSLEGVPFTVVGGGYTHGGGRVFLQVKLTGEADTLVNGDPFDSHITLYSSHDGSSAFEIFDTNVRIICQNTLQASRRHGGKRFKLSVKHTSQVQFRFEDMLSQLDKILAVRQRTFRDMHYLNEIFMDNEEIKQWAMGFFNVKKTETPQARTKAEEVARLSREGLGNIGVSAYDALNGVTEMLTHGTAGKRRENGAQFLSSEFGTNANVKAQALDLLANSDARHRLITRGRELIHTGVTLTSRPTAKDLVNVA